MTNETDPRKGPVDLSTAKVISDTFFVSFSRILVLILRPIRGIVLGRLLGPALYGILNIPVPYVNILKLFSNIGFNTAVLKLVPEYRQKGRPELARMILRSTATMTVALGALWSVLMVLFAPAIAERIAHRPDALNPIRVYALIIPFLAMNTFYISAYIAVQRGKLQAMITVWHGVLQVFLPIVLVLLRRDVTLVIAGFLAAEVAGMILFASFFGRRALARFGRETGPLARGMGEVWNLGRLFFFTDLGVVLIYSVDKLMVQYMLPIEEYGFYAMATLVLTALATITTTGGIALVPSLSAARESNDLLTFRRQVTNTAHLGFLVLVPVVALIFVLTGDVFALLLERFLPSVPVIRTLVCIGLMLVFIRVAWAALAAHGRGKAASTAYVAAAIWNIIWNWILIPRYGIMGAAYATLSTFVILAICLQIFMRRVAGVGVSVIGLLPPLFISLIFPLLGWLLRGSGHIARIVVVFAAGGAFYCILSLVTGYVTRADLENAAANLRPRAHVLHVRIALGLIDIASRLARGRKNT